MAAITFPEFAKSARVPSGITYSYIHIPPKDANSHDQGNDSGLLAQPHKPTILFLHGFPSSSHDFIYQIKHFSALGYGVLAPDLLGYGDTDVPNELQPYAFKAMADDIAALLEREGLLGFQTVHIVGHDFGAIFLGTLLAYYPMIARTCVCLAIPLCPLGERLDLDVAKEHFEKTFGFELFGYRRFLIRDDSWKLLDEHKESFFSLVYGPEEYMSTNFFPAGALEAWLQADRRAPREAWVTEEYKTTRDRIFAHRSYRGPTNWYRSRWGPKALGIDDEARDLASGKIEARVRRPTLFIKSAGDQMISKSFAIAMMRQWCGEDGRLEYREVDAVGHWVHIEARDEVNEVLTNFFARN